MSLEDFRPPPESRLPYVVVMLTALSAIRCAWEWFVHSRFSVELASVATVGAIGYAVWRYVRERPAHL